MIPEGASATVSRELIRLAARGAPVATSYRTEAGAAGSLKVRRFPVSLGTWTL